MGKLSPMLVCLTAMVYLSVYFPLLHCLVLTRSRGAGGRGRVIVKATGGTSRGGSSVSRDERWDRLGNWGRSLLKNLNGVLEKRACSLDNPDDIQRMLPGRFMSEEDLLRIMPVAESRGQQYSPARRLVVPSRRLSEPIAPRTRLETQPAFDIKASNSFLGDRCGCCLTEIGYEIVEQVMDFSGQNHTVINFNNAYQFIPSGRCVNENSPCGGGGRARCKQITRAHWSLVWTSGKGVNLVAHEVPSHCECINFGSSNFPLRTAQHQTSHDAPRFEARNSGRRTVGGVMAGMDVHMSETVDLTANVSLPSTAIVNVTSASTSSTHTSESTSAVPSSSSSPAP